MVLAVFLMVELVEVTQGVLGHFDHNRTHFDFEGVVDVLGVEKIT